MSLGLCTTAPANFGKVIQIKARHGALRIMGKCGRQSKALR
jgi:hypothetical protein